MRPDVSANQLPSGVANTPVSVLMNDDKWKLVVRLSPMAAIASGFRVPVCMSMGPTVI